MARSHQTRASSLASGAARHKASLQQKKSSYKVVLEEVTEKKKKLSTHLVFNTTAPPGYTFIPAGDPQLTNRCKEFARKDGADVYIVNAAPSRRVSTLSREVHRVGYHFPSTVVEKACTSLSVSLSSSGKVIYNQRPPSAGPIVRPGRKGKPRKRKLVAKQVLSQLEASQAEIDTEAKEAIKDLFPNIPDYDLYAVVRLAFKKGSNLVGTADLPLYRRAQLGVLAHIRHTYTNYDQLLRTGEWIAARTAVEPLCLDKLVQWRGDDEDNTDAMSDILREVIVIPDDEDENESSSVLENVSNNDHRQASVEVVATRAAANAFSVSEVDYRGPLNGNHSTALDSDGSDLGAYRVPPTTDRSRLNRLDAHRHKAWAAARSRHRKDPQKDDDDINNYNLIPLGEPGLRQETTRRASVVSHETYKNNHAFQANRVPCAPVTGRFPSSPRERIADQIVDLTTDSPYPRNGPPTHNSFRTTSFLNNADNLYGRPEYSTVSRHPTGTRVVALAETVNSASDHARRGLRSHPQHHSEQILPSIEQLYRDFDGPNPFQSEYRRPPSRSLIRHSGQNGPEISSAWDPAISDPGTGKKQEHAVNGAIPSPYSASQTAGTVLIPLEEYNERHRRHVQVLNAGRDNNIVRSGSEEYRGSPHNAHDSASTVAYSSHVRSPQRTSRGPDERYQRPPHLQVQLHPGPPGLPSASPCVLRSPQSDTFTFFPSPHDKSIVYGASGPPSLTRNSSAILDNGFWEKVPTNNIQIYGPTAVRVPQKQPGLQGTTRYTRSPDAPLYNDDPFRERDRMGLSYPKWRPSPRVAELWRQDLGTKEHQSAPPQRVVDSHAVTHGPQPYQYLPVRSHQEGRQAFTKKSNTPNTHEEIPLFPSYEPREFHRPRELNTADQPLARQQMVTYVPYGTANASFRTQTRRESVHIEGPRREVVIID